jgi:hypothetical protein
MSQELIAVEIVRYLLYSFRFDIKWDEKLEKSENALYEKNLIFSIFFLPKLSQNNLILISTVKRQKNVDYFFLK